MKTVIIVVPILNEERLFEDFYNSELLKSSNKQNQFIEFYDVREFYYNYFLNLMM